MLHSWLLLDPTSEKQTVASGTYEVLNVREKIHGDPDSAMVQIREWLRHCYAEPEYVRRRVTAGAYADPEVLFQKEKFPSSKNTMVRHGDFGEAIGHFILEAHPALCFWVPIQRLRYKDDPEKSHFGFDLLGFRLADNSGTNNVLCIGEAKLRTSKDLQVATEAHNSLCSCNRAREIAQVGRIAHYLWSQGRTDESDQLALFADAWAAEQFERRHVLVAVFDTSLPCDEMLRALEKADKLLSTLTVCIVGIPDLALKIAQAYQL